MLKKIIIIPALVIAALIVAVYAFLYLYGFNTFKPLITQAVKDATGRDLIINGDIRIIPGWPPTLTAENITFQNAPWGSQPQLARVKKLSVAISLLPILRGEYRLIHIHLVEPEVLLEFNPSGVSNFQFDTSNSGESVAIPVLAFNDIRIQKGRFRYKDPKSGLDLSLDIGTLQADIPGLDQPIRIQFQGGFRGLPCTLDGSIGPIMAWIKPGYPLPVELTAGLGKTDAQLTGTIRNPINFKGISLKITADGQSTREVTNLGGWADIPDFGIFSVEAELNDGPGQLALEQLAVHMGSEELARLSLSGSVGNLLEMQGVHLDIQLQAKNIARLSQLGMPALPVEGPFRISATISDPAKNQYRLDDIGILLGENTITGRVDLNLARKVPILDVKLESEKFQFGSFSLETRMAGPVDRISVEKLELKLDTEKRVKAFMIGTIENLNALDNINLNFHAYGEDLADLQELIGKPLPLRGRFAVSGSLTMPAQHIFQIPELKIILDKNSLSGSLDLDLGGSNPILGGTFTSSRLNIERLLTPALLPENLLESLTEVGPTRLTFESSGPFDQLTLSRLEFQTNIKDLVALNLQGSIGDLSHFSGVDLSFMARGNDLANLEKIAGRNIPLKGAYSLSGKLQDGAEKKYRIENIQVSTGLNTLKGRTTIDLSGPNPIISAEIAARGFTLSALSSGQYPTLDHLKRVDDLGPFDIRVTVIPSSEGIALQDLDISAGNDALAKIRVKGSVVDLYSLKGMQFSFNASGQDIANLELITGRPLPVRGSYAVSGLVSEHAPNNIMIGDLKLSLGENQLKGWVNINMTGKHPLIETELSADHITFEPITHTAIDPLKDIPDLGPLNLSIKLSQTGDSQKVNYLDFSMGHEDTIAVILRGTIRDIDPLSGISLEFSVTSKDLSILNSAYGTEYVNKMPIHVAGRFENPKPGSYTISSLQAIYGDSDLAGSVSLDLKADRPDMEAQLLSRKLDLRSIIETFHKKNPSPEKSNKSSKKRDRVFSRQPFSLEALDRLDVDVTFQSQELLLPNLAFNDVLVNLSLDKDDLNIDPLKFIIGGGSAEGKLILQSRKSAPFLKTKLEISQFDIGPMLKQLGHDSALKGKLDATFDLAGNGNSVAALMAGLNGNVFISIHDGQMESKHLALLEKYLGSNILGLLNPFKSKSTLTPVNCLVNTMNIKNGDAAYKLVLDTDQTALLVVGPIDFETEELDIGIKPTPKKGFGGSNVGSISFSLSKLSQPFGLGGTLVKPQLVIDPTRTAVTAGIFAGAMALGPIGIGLFFSDISVGKKNICEEASKAMQSD
ncbi:MAG: AsmA family protein [Deltaproteobacteria bacterium]|nr:AsmA family protein [Deltaproteobacteria bacterium]